MVHVGLAELRALAKLGPDRISIGRLTHSAPALDLGLDLAGDRGAQVGAVLVEAGLEPGAEEPVEDQGLDDEDEGDGAADDGEVAAAQGAQELDGLGPGGQVGPVIGEREGEVPGLGLVGRRNRILHVHGLRR